MRPLDVVLFDLDDTLHDDTASYTSAAAEVARALSRRSSVDANRLASAFDSQLRQFWKNLTVEAMQAGVESMRARMWGEALRAAAGDPSYATWAAQRFEALRLERYATFPEALPFLSDLKAKGMRLGLVTNGFRVTHRQKISVLGLDRLFDGIFLSDEVSFVKPDPEFFLHVCREMEVVPERTAMVGDRYDKDLTGPISLGMVTVWINVHKKALPDGAGEPTIVVDTLAEARLRLLQFLNAAD